LGVIYSLENPSKVLLEIIEIQSGNYLGEDDIVRLDYLWTSYTMSIKVVILAGGLGTRFTEESHLKPKPMIELGGEPILIHIMNHYAKFGLKEFIILAGYKCEVIFDYFSNFYQKSSKNTIFNLSSGNREDLQIETKDWNVQVINSGLNTQTGGRLLYAKDFVEENFFLTYGDGVSDIDVDKVLDLHKSNKNTVTLTAVQPEARFGALEFSGENMIQSFNEKPKGDGHWINGGYFCCSQEIFNFIRSEEEILEKYPLDEISKKGKLGAYKHHGFWHPMDTLRDKLKLEKMLEEGNAPWI
jgi:glucose-1-phosphate cytidylyltransferase